MMKYSLLLLFLIGCASDPVTAPVPIPKAAPIAPSAKNPAFYQGYAVSSRYDCATHTFSPAAGDSASAQIRVTEADNEIKATIAITGEDRPYDVFLFLHNGYYVGSDSSSYAYFSTDYSTFIWGRRSQEDGNLYQAIYAAR